MAVNLVAVLFSFLALAVPSYGSPYDEGQIIPAAERADFLDLPVEGELQLNALSNAPSFSSVTMGKKNWKDLWGRPLMNDRASFQVDFDIWSRFPTCPEKYSLKESECITVRLDFRRDINQAVYYHVNSDENRVRWPEPERTLVEMSVKEKEKGQPEVDMEFRSGNVRLSKRLSQRDGFELHSYPKTCLMLAPSERYSKKDWVFGWNWAGWSKEDKDLVYWQDSVWPWCENNDWIHKVAHTPTCEAERGVSMCRRCPPYQGVEMETDFSHENNFGFKTAKEQILGCKDKFVKSSKECSAKGRISTLEECREAAAQFGMSAWLNATDYIRKNLETIKDNFILSNYDFDDTDSSDPILSDDVLYERFRKRHMEAPTWSTFYFYTLADDGLLVLKQDGITNDNFGGRCFFVELSEKSEVPNKHAAYWTTMDLLRHKDVLRGDLEKRNATEKETFELCKRGYEVAATEP